MTHLGPTLSHYSHDSESEKEARIFLSLGNKKNRLTLLQRFEALGLRPYKRQLEVN